MITRGRQLRQRATVPERLLWGRLRDGRCAGLKFRRQQPLGEYVVDFFCATSRIVVELDGRSHEGRGVEDEVRQELLERQGIRVLRFTNDQVLADLQGVVEAIAAVCVPRDSSIPRKAPSPGPAGHPLP
jgi:very-short-patch-repair endonuclease